MTNAKKLVLAGDHQQLPPVVLSEKSHDAGLGVSFMEKVAPIYPECVSFLSTQFRSHADISNWSSGQFYEGKLSADPSVAATLLADLPGVRRSTETVTPFLFIDTAGAEYYEQMQIEVNPAISESDQSITNYNEAFVIDQLVQKYVSLGVKPSDIGVIAPYWAQVSLIRALLWDEERRGEYSGVEVRTVDGFQGREKELILLSFVRSNPDGVIGFLEESRRINVSVTRARKCCIIVGDSETLARNNKPLRSLVDYCKDIGAHIHVNEVM